MDRENNTKLIYHTAKFKLKEAKYFVEQIKKNWDDEDYVSFNLNAFTISACSVIDYVESDFILHKIRPRILGKDWFKEKTRKKILKTHPMSKIICDFIEFYEDQEDNLRNEPLPNYFINKRNTIVHERWEGPKMSSFTEKDGIRTANSRRLEPGYLLDLASNKPDYQLNICEDRISRKKKLELLSHLVEDPMMDIIFEFIIRLEKFIEGFEKKDFFS